MIFYETQSLDLNENLEMIFIELSEDITQQYETCIKMLPYERLATSTLLSILSMGESKKTSKFWKHV